MTTRRDITDIKDNLDEARATVLLISFATDITLAGNTVRDAGDKFILEFAEGSRRKPMTFATALPAVRQLKRLATAQARRIKKACLAQK